MLNRVKLRCMLFDPSMLTISATKPAGNAACLLNDAGATVVPIREEDGAVDRKKVRTLLRQRPERQRG